jgi:hypothetical protein
MPRWIRRAILAVAAVASLALLAAAAAAFLVVPRPEFQQWLGGRLSKVLGPGVDFASVSLAFWPLPGIRLHEVTLGKATGEETDGVSSVDSVSCTLLPRALLGGEIVVGRITIEKPILSVERDAEGQWFFGSALQQILAHAADSGRAEPEPGLRPLPRLFLHDGAIDLEDRRVAGGPVTVHMRNLDIDVELSRSGDPGHLRISLDGPEPAHLEVDMKIDPMAPGESLSDVAFEAEVRGRSLESDRDLLYLLFGLPIRNPGGVFDIEGSVSGRIADAVEGRATIDVPAGFVDGWGIRLATPVRLAASFEVKNGEFSMHRARLDAPGAGFAGYAAETTEAVFDWAEDELQVEKLDFDAYGGAWTAGGRVSFAGTPTFSSEIRADRVAFRELAAAVAGEDVEESFETASGEANLRGDWTGPDSWQGTLTGSGRLQLAGGQIESSPVMRSLFEAAFGKIPGVSHLSGGERSEPPTKLESLVASFTLRDARAFTEDLDLSTSAYRMEGKGSLGFDGSLQLSTRVALTARGVDEVYRWASIPFGKRGDNALPAVPVHVNGTIGDPQIVPDLTGLSLAPFRALFGGAEGAVELLQDAAPKGRLLRKGLGKVLGSGEEDGDEVREDEPDGAGEPPDAGPREPGRPISAGRIEMERCFRPIPEISRPAGPRRVRPRWHAPCFFSRASPAAPRSAIWGCSEARRHAPLSFPARPSGRYCIGIARPWGVFRGA